MQINPYNFLENKKYQLEGDIDFSSTDLSAIFNLKKINNCHVDIDINNYENVLVLSLKIKANVTLVSSYSLKEFDKDLSINDTIDFSFNEEDEDSSFVIKDSNLILDKYILDIIITNIPSKVAMKGEKLPVGDESFRVISEDEYLKEKENQKDDRWSKLDDIDL